MFYVRVWVGSVRGRKRDKSHFDFERCVGVYTSMLSARFLMTVTCSSSTGFRRKTFSLYGRTHTHTRTQEKNSVTSFCIILTIFVLFYQYRFHKSPRLFNNTCAAAGKGLHLWRRESLCLKINVDKDQKRFEILSGPKESSQRNGTMAAARMHVSSTQLNRID